MSSLLETAMKTMLKEAFDGPADPHETWFTNNEPNSGIFGALEAVSSHQASMSVNGTTLAAHANHVRYHMWGTNEFLKNGIYPAMDWAKSWQPHTVAESDWLEVQAQLRSEYLSFLNAMDVTEWDQPIANEVLASLAHLAYHLGAIRQILKVVKGG